MVAVLVNKAASKAIKAYMNEPLSVKEERFVENVALYGMSIAQACKLAGCSRQIANKISVRAAIAEMRALNAQKMEMTRDKVLGGLSDAIDRAKLMGEPLTEIAGWREVAKICGFYDSEKGKKDLTDKQRKFLDQIQDMSDEELAMLTAKNVNTIDGEVVHATPVKKAS